MYMLFVLLMEGWILANMKYSERKTDAELKKDRRDLCVNGEAMPRARFIMQIFLRRKLGRYEFVHHIDGNPKNDVFSNLQIVSPKEHAYIHTEIRRKKKGLPVPSVIEVERMLDAGLSSKEIAAVLLRVLITD